MRKRLIVASAACLVVGMAAVAIVRWLRSSESSPWPRATRLSVPNGYFYWYGWQSNQNVLFFDTDQHARSTAVRLDTAHNTQTPLTTFNSTFNINLRNYFFEPAVSPNGQWLLYVGSSGTGPTWTAAKLDHTQTRMFGPTAGGPLGAVAEPKAVWLSDSRHWVGLCNSPQGPQARVHDLLFPQTVRSLRLPLRSAYDGDLLGSTQDGRVLVFLPTQLGQGKALFCLFDPQNPAKPVQTFTVSIPRFMHVEEVRLSPQGDRLAWKWRFNNRKPDTSRLGEWKWNLGLTPSTDMVLCVSNLQGNHLRRLGKIQMPLHQVGIQNILWTPDGKRLSFWYGRELWSLPVGNDL